VDFEAFRSILAKAHEKERKGNAGRKPCDVVVMFKMLGIAMLYNLSDEQVQYQVRDRISFMGSLGLEPGDRVPDEKTLWLFRERLTELGLIEELFDQFNQHLDAQGFKAQQGHIVDANIVEVPKQRNTRDDNAQIKGGERPASFDENPAKGRQKDTDAPWTVKRKRNYFGDKNHVNSDAKHKFVRRYKVTDASVYDSQCWRMFSIQAIRTRPWTVTARIAARRSATI